MNDKLKSRKLWVALGSVASILIAEFFGATVSPEAIAGVAVLATSYIFGQGIVDKSVASETVRVQGDVARLQVELYARNLEKELAKFAAEPGVSE